MRLGDNLYDVCAVKDLRYAKRLPAPEIVKMNLPLAIALRMIAEYRALNPTIEFLLSVLHPAEDTDA